MDAIPTDAEIFDINPEIYENQKTVVITLVYYEHDHVYSACYVYVCVLWDGTVGRSINVCYDKLNHCHLKWMNKKKLNILLSLPTARAVGSRFKNLGF